jgi:hypothetical protein
MERIFLLTVAVNVFMRRCQRVYEGKWINLFNQSRFQIAI